MSKLGGTASGAASGAAAGSVLGPWGAAAGGVIGGVAGFFGSSNQEDEQRKLTEIQSDANARLMGQSYALQKDMYDHTYNKNTPEQQVKNLKAAGLNPALMYASGGAGVSNTTAGGGGSSVGGATASGSAERQAAQNQQIGMALQLAKLKSEVKVNESVAEVNEANARKATEDATTTGSTRETLLENMRQSGIAQWIENRRNDWMNWNNPQDMSGENAAMYRNKVYNEDTGIQAHGGFSREIAGKIAKAMADTGNAEANALLTNEKAKGYWQELLNATKNADSQAIQAAAVKLASEWSTGEYTNWKTWVQTAETAIGAVGDLMGGIGQIGKVIKMKNIK